MVLGVRQQRHTPTLISRVDADPYMKTFRFTFEKKKRNFTLTEARAHDKTLQ